MEIRNKVFLILLSAKDITPENEKIDRKYSKSNAIGNYIIN